jgi:FKBP-type peptidyl-prolyl cis-trans isomerase SlyD
LKLDKIEVDSVVSIHYSLSLDGGEQIDSSQGSAPLDYLHGHDNIVPGLEEELTGRQVGDKLSVAVPPEKGYGIHDPQGVQDLPRSTFPEGLELQPNVMLQGQDAQGQPVQLRVVDVSDETVKVDLNHPLAGHNLNFEVEIMGIRSATQEELSHGHVHGPGGHDH